MNTERAKIMVVDDHTLLLDTLSACFNVGMNVVARCCSGDDIVQKALATQPNLILLDAVIPGKSSLQAYKELKLSAPNIRCVVYSGSYSQDLLEECYSSGVHGYINKAQPWENLLKAIHSVLEGKTCFEIANQQNQLEKLTKRETEVLRQVALGRSTKDIAINLGLAVKTIDTHRANLMTKTSLHDVASLTRYAIRQGLVTGH